MTSVVSYKLAIREARSGGVVRNELGENGSSSIRLQKEKERRYAAKNNLVLSGSAR